MGCSGSKQPTKLLTPKQTKFRVAVVGFVTPGGDEKNTDKDKHGHRYDSIPIANGLINAGCAADLINYTPNDHEGFVEQAMHYDALILRIMKGQLDAEGVPQGTRQRFDQAMDQIAIKGKVIWSNPHVQNSLGAKDSLVKISQTSVGLPDTFAYYDRKDFEDGFKKSAAFSPRVIKQNRGNEGEGIWLVWLESKRYCETFGEKMLTDRDRLKLMEMCDNHVEYHTVKEFVAFCCDGPGGAAAGNMWASQFPGKYLEGGKAAGGQIVDQRLLPRIVEGEVHMQMVEDQLFQIVHKKPKTGTMQADSGEYSFHPPNAPEFAELRKNFERDIPAMMDAMQVGGEPLPLLWTADFIPVDDHESPCVISEMNCSCVGIPSFAAARGHDLKNVPPYDLAEGYRLTNLMGVKAVETLEKLKSGGGFTAIGQKANPKIAKPSKRSFKEAPTMMGSNLGREATPLPVRR